MTKELAEILKKLGVGGHILVAILVIALLFYIYSQMLETKLTKLEIESLRIELGKDPNSRKKA